MPYEPPEIAKLLAEKRFADAVEQYVGRTQHVSFVELQRLLEPHMPVNGDVALALPDCPTCLLWASMSPEFSEVVIGLLVAKRLHPHPASVMIYMIDGGMLSLPIAKTRRAMQSKKEHWLPVSLCTYALEGKRKGTLGVAVARKAQT